jgi:hypothetical protein
MAREEGSEEGIVPYTGLGKITKTQSVVIESEALGGYGRKVSHHITRIQ